MNQKLTEEDRVKLVELRHAGLSYRKIGAKFGVSQVAVQNIIVYYKKKYNLQVPHAAYLKHENTINKLKKKHPEWFKK